MTASDYRKDFPLLQNEDTIYIDNAATAQRPQAVLDAVKVFYETENANPLRGFYPLSLKATESCENARATEMRLRSLLWSITAIFCHGRWWHVRPVLN